MCILLPALNKPLVKSISATFPTAANPTNPRDKHTIEEANRADTTLIRLVIIILTAKTFLNTTIENNKGEYNYLSATNKTKNINKLVNNYIGEDYNNYIKLEYSIRDKSSLFILDKS